MRVGVSDVSLDQGFSQLGPGIAARPERIEDQPVVARPEARQDAGTNQRRLAAAGGPEHHDESWGPSIEELDTRERFLFPSEEHRCVLFLVGVQSKVGWLSRIPFAGHTREVELLERAPETREALRLIRP